jgi:tRNA(His) guanylyltransferase
MKDLGDRMKQYEKTFSYKVPNRLPVIIRVDGRAFHTLTKKCKKPFDYELMKTMDITALDVAKNMQGFKFGYVQSDEVTFCLTDYDRIESGSWFDYKISKIISISAAHMTAAFNLHSNLENKMAMFDSRAFTVPVNEVANVFLWRAKDWARNSLQMYTRAFFSHKELNGKKMKDMHEMLHKKGLNWSSDISSREKNGCFIIKSDNQLFTRTDITPTYENIKLALPESIFL